MAVEKASILPDMGIRGCRGFQPDSEVQLDGTVVVDARRAC